MGQNLSFINNFKVKQLIAYLGLNIIWYITYFLASPVKMPELFLLLGVISLFYTVIWVIIMWLLTYANDELLRASLVIPVVFALIICWVIDKHTFRFLLGLLVVSEISLIVMIRSEKHN